MLIRRLSERLEFLGGDGTRLRELLNARTEPLECRYSLAHARLDAGRSSILHALKSSEVYYILSGSGEMEIDGEREIVNPGDTIFIPPLAKQRLHASGDVPLEFLCIVDPAWRPEDETVLA